MGLDLFAIWKFKNIEGILKHFYAYDFLITKYQKGSIVFFIHYDISSETVKLTSDTDIFLDGLTCKFNDLHNLLKKQGYFELKDKINCHTSAIWNNSLFN